MNHSRIGIIACVCLLAASLGRGAEPAVTVASGVLSKATVNVLIVNPRNADGRFGNAIALKVTRTSKISALTLQTREGQQVLVQRDAAPATLEPNQRIAVIFVALRDDNILLAAVVQPK